ncbi:MAG TPA: preprotein translocase subunit SecE [Clostridiaceae bacterium]|nr:preprotein translocase subunit SecE [Clostridiaceae bacterium]
MAELKNKGKKQNFFVRFGKRIAKWFREMKAELKKVVWPTPKQVLNNTWVVVVTVLIVGVVISLFGLAATSGISFLIGLAK